MTCKTWIICTRAFFEAHAFLANVRKAFFFFVTVSCPQFAFSFHRSHLNVWNFLLHVSLLASQLFTQKLFMSQMLFLSPCDLLQGCQSLQEEIQDIACNCQIVNSNAGWGEVEDAGLFGWSRYALDCVTRLCLNIVMFKTGQLTSAVTMPLSVSVWLLH